MPRKVSLYKQMRACVETQETASLSTFEKPTFWKRLSEEDRKDLAHLFLMRAERAFPDEECVTESIAMAEQIAPLELSTHCQAALLLFRLGLKSQKGAHLGAGLDRISHAQALCPEFFEQAPQWWHLFGNILVAIHNYAKDVWYLERALEKYEKAAKASEEADFLWDWGQCYILLGVESGECGDFHKGLALFKRAAALGCSSPSFWADYGRGLIAIGKLEGKPSHVREALDLLEKAIVDAYHPKHQGSEYEKGWRAYTHAHHALVHLTGDTELFFAADEIYCKALQAVPQCADLWLDWGELYLRMGWQRKHLRFIECAVEKFSSSKVAECDPIRVSLLLGETLVLLGAMTDTLAWIQEGEKRLRTMEDLLESQPRLQFALGQVHLAKGIYFEQESDFQSAIAAFDTDPSSEKHLMGIFEAYFGWGLIAQSVAHFKMCLPVLERLTQMCPSNASFWNHWGITLVSIYKITRANKALLEEALSKFRKALSINRDLEWLFSYATALEMLADETADTEAFEEAIKWLQVVHEKAPTSSTITLRLAEALTHYGELIACADTLYRAATLYDKITCSDGEHDTAWCQWGYTLLNLSVLTSDPALPQKELELRAEAERMLVKALTLGNIDALYHLACLYSLSGLMDAAIDSLIRAQQAHALPPFEDLMNDEWLEGVRSTEAFREFSMTRGGDGRA